MPFSPGRLHAAVLTEAGLGLLVFLGVGVLTASPPARGPQYADAEKVRDSLTQQVDDLLVTLSVKPNQPGQNILSIRVTSTRRPPLAEILRVILRFTYQGQEIGTISQEAQAVDPGLYRMGGSYLSLAGPWRIEVVVRRGGLEDSVAQFDWHVAVAGQSQPAILSNHPWESILTAVSIWLFGFILTIGIIFGLTRSSIWRKGFRNG